MKASKFKTLVAGAALAAAFTTPAHADDYGTVTIFNNGKVSGIPESQVQRIVMRETGTGKVLKTITSPKCFKHDTASLAKQLGENDPAVQTIKEKIAQSQGVLRDIFMICNTGGSELPFTDPAPAHYSGGPQTNDFLMVEPATRGAIAVGGYDYLLMAPDRTAFLVIVGKEKLLNKQ